MLEVDINPECRIDVSVVGSEKTPVVIVDDVLRSTASLRNFASSVACFSEEGLQGYPGVRAPLPREYAAALIPRLRDVIADVYRPSATFDCRLVHQLFSLVSQDPESLGVLQRLPHFDNHNPFYFATVHFLNDGAHGGTGIFRHRPTGFESVTQDRYPRFVQSAQAHVKANGEPPKRYIRESDDHFELIAELEYRPNRLLLYPGYIFHSGLIDPERDISSDPVSGRLTANLFLLCS